ncbi:hypothetical protein OG21DRAFT_1505771 [Imleria badia]|nr:hypothetical protein OG21DRAFT_1505771 [Imleria badia]
MAASSTLHLGQVQHYYPWRNIDPNLIVVQLHGTSNLRVVDLSIVPLHVGSHTQSLAYAIAEQAAHFIKTEYGL